jgi:hypothetical protein
MPATTLNGTSFAGLVTESESIRRAPQNITPKPYKVGKTLVGPDGQRARIHRGAKSDWLLEWDKAPEVTRAAVRTIFDLTSTFSATLLGGTYTVQCEDEDYSEEQTDVLPDGTRYFRVTLLVRQA